jgi:hypothetical protein
MHAVSNMRLDRSAAAKRRRGAAGASRSRVFILASLALLAAACRGPAQPQPGNLLHGIAPREVVGLDHAERISDGITPVDGDPWLTDLSATFARDAHAVFDLGRVTPVSAAFVQGDNNDTFVLELSDDGRHYREVWRASPVPGPGMRPRFTSALEARGRYLRIHARGGDAYVSIGELMVFASKPAMWPPPLRHRHGGTPELPGQRSSFAASAAAVLLLLLGLRRVPRWLLAAGAAIALGTLAWWLRDMYALWPIDQNLVAIQRPLIAALPVFAGCVW